MLDIQVLDNVMYLIYDVNIMNVENLLNYPRENNAFMKLLTYN